MIVAVTADVDAHAGSGAGAAVAGGVAVGLSTRSAQQVIVMRSKLSVVDVMPNSRGDAGARNLSSARQPIKE